MRDKCFGIVLEVLNKYDPFNIRLCCGDKEYNIEANEIASRSTVLNSDRLALWCKDVFDFWLYPIDDMDMWRNIANEIKENIK
jgi:hypothetical protein